MLRSRILVCFLALRGLGICPNKRVCFWIFPLWENLKNGGLLRNKPMLAFLEKWQGHFSVFQGLGDYPNAYGNNCSERCFLWIGGFRKFGLFGVKFGDAVQYMRAIKKRSTVPSVNQIRHSTGLFLILIQRQNIATPLAGHALDGFCWKRYTAVPDGGIIWLFPSSPPSA